jgi:hypothetical protein
VGVHPSKTRHSTTKPSATTARVASGVAEPMVVSHEPSQPWKIAAVDRGVEGQDDRLIG